MTFRYPVAAHPLLDAHCHGVVTDDLTDAEFEPLSSESRIPARPGWSPLDSPVGLAIRRWCAPVLDLPKHAPIAEYLTGGRSDDHGARVGRQQPGPAPDPGPMIRAS